MENSQENVYGNGVAENNGYIISPRNTSHYSGTTKVSLAWLDLRVFYVRVGKCVIDESTPENLTLNHIPLNRDTLLEVNGVRTSIYSDGESTLLKRDRLDKKSEEVTFVSTDSLRTTGSLRFEVFDKDVLLLSGVLELCYSNGVLVGESVCSSRCQGQRWRMNCEMDTVLGNGFLKVKQNMGLDSDSPEIEVCLAGSFSGDPIILTKSLQLSSTRKKQVMRKGMLESIPEYETSTNQKDVSSGLPLQIAGFPNHKPENEEYASPYSEMEYMEGEDGELTWFNAGVRVGVGIGLSVCLGLGIGVGLLVRTYQGTTRSFRRRLL